MSRVVWVQVEDEIHAELVALAAQLLMPVEAVVRELVRDGLLLGEPDLFSPLRMAIEGRRSAT